MLDFYGTSSLKKQSADRHVAQLGHIILIIHVFVWIVKIHYILYTLIEISAEMLQLDGFVFVFVFFCEEFSILYISSEYTQPCLK